jgi:rhodanese-related sulfurtransferase
MLKSPAQLADEARKEIPEVQAADVRKDMDKGPLSYVLLDVRETQEQAAGIIPGASCLPRGIVELHIAKAVQDENAPIVCYCGGGTRSLFVAQQLKRMGYTNVKSMAGGFKAWTTGGHPVTRPE